MVQHWWVARQRRRNQAKKLLASTAHAPLPAAPPHVLVDSLLKAKHALKDINASVAQSKAVAVDIEGDLRPTGRLSLVQIGLESETVFLFDVLRCPHLLGADAGLRALLSGPATKVMHDCRNDAAALKGQFNIVLKEVWDTQTTHAILVGKDPKSYQQGLNAILDAYAGRQNSHKKQVKHGPGVWEERPLSALLQSYAAQDVQHLVKAYRTMFDAIVAKNLLGQASQASASRLARTLKSSTSVQVQLQETATAFWDYVQSSRSVIELEDRNAFTKVFEEWKSAEASSGSVRKGGASRVLFTLVRTKKIKAKNASTVVFADSGGLAAAIARVKASREDIAANKHGVEVSTLEFEVVPVGGSCQRQITIRNTAPQDRSLEAVELMNTCNFAVSLQRGELPVQLRADASTTLSVDFTPKVVGVAGSTLCLIFKGTGSGKFTIGRYLEARCGDRDLLDDLRPSAPFERIRKARSRPWQGRHKLPQSNGPGAPQSQDAPKLEKHEIPQEWRQTCELGEADDHLRQAHATLAALSSGNGNSRGLTMAYIKDMQRLLWSEEIQLENDLAGFNLEGTRATTFEKEGRHLRLTVAGLAERRPSLLKGDFLRARLQGARDPDVYKGQVEVVEREDVLLRFHNRLHEEYITGQRVEIQFILSRAPWRLFHQGLSYVSNDLATHVLFPCEDEIHNLRQAAAALNRSAFNRRIADNPQQWHAVSSIVDRSHQPYPFVVFGPPGTGKTSTLVEAILQILKSEPTLKVLVCAPTNTAADVLCSRLTLNTSEMLRLMGYSRNSRDVPSSVLPYTCHKDGQFLTPPLAEIEEKRVVVATLATASKLINIGVAPRHFGLVVMDEAGQAMEPEIVAVLGPLKIPQVVLGGDPKQLGPVIHSPEAQKHGLKTSLLERLLGRPMYADYDPKYITMLKRNYRSHALLLEVPNALFYDGALEAFADPMITDCRLHWDGLPTQGVPLCWQGVEGKEDREAGSPSWFNSDEAVIVLKRVTSLMRMRPDCKQENIGIITAYNKQVHKIMRLLKMHDLGDIKVGSTETFQGQERQIIIISTVRSSLDFLGFDVKHNIGFLDNPKRFNVAVTRACSLLIVVGNPHVFIGDPHWGKLLKLCIDKGAYTGVSIRHGAENLDHDELLAAQEKMENLLLQDDPDSFDLEHTDDAEMPEFDN